MNSSYESESESDSTPKLSSNESDIEPAEKTERLASNSIAERTCK